MSQERASSPARSHRSNDRTIRTLIERVDELVPITPDMLVDEERLAEMRYHLTQLHASLRMAHAASCLSGQDVASTELSPELNDQREQLSSEKLVLIGMLDRILRTSESILDQIPEDIDVFILRVSEMLAILRRHMAEEDRLICLSVWHDTGGES